MERRHPEITMFQRPDRLDAPLHVITTVFNSPRFRSRWRLYEDFAHHVAQQPHAVLWTAEVAFGERHFSVTDPANPRHLQLRTSHELWLKERMINLAVQRLPADWKYVAWVDADITFVRGDWSNETMHALQHYPVVQMWRTAFDLNVDHEAVKEHRSFASCRLEGCTVEVDAYTGKGRMHIVHQHPGFAWAMRRDCWDAMGGLIDTAILGSADNHMAHALAGSVERTIQSGLHPRYKGGLRAWQARAEAFVRGNVGCVPGTVLHSWHGPKAARAYRSRWEILTDTGFNPDVDLRVDWQGLWQLTSRSRALRDRVRAYFHGRDEDART